MAEQRPLRVAIGGFFHETHSFAVPKTALEGFSLYRGQEILETFRGNKNEMGGAIDALSPDLALVPLLYAYALPSGMIERRAYEAIAAEVVTRLHSEQPDALFLVLHGAMMVEGMTDAEGDLLKRVRTVLGDRPLAVSLDFHGNISREMAGVADLMVGYRTVPHVDAYERARACCELLRRQLRGEIHPVMHLTKPPIISVPPAQFTDREPMKRLLARAVEMEQDPRVLSVSIFGGFAYADEERTGMACLVITDDDPGVAERLAGELNDLVWAAREQFQVSALTPAEAVRRALAHPAPVALVDVSDNVGGGAPGDGTALLAELLAAGAKGALVTLWDPEAVEQAFATGEGGLLTTAVGGKTDSFHGAPVPITWKVIRLQPDGRWRNVGRYMTGQPSDMGRAALVRVAGVDIILTEKRIPAFDRGYLARLGVDARDYRIHTPKAGTAWLTAFGDVVDTWFFVDTPGITPINLNRLPFHRLRRPIYPIDPM